ncbi:phosphopantetheine-binding protein [Microbacterium sp. PRC9]|uniref:acyl carrier protein n=1 Tax=Microbacterium sp. PRC9 TaxID=2962591 RepID=UPI0028828CC1|nr:phosphopantetheine-binding protein [Microbacterium sp. PRC9]MDT0142238.1 phosphopantetheine-binding protein [Microbacterium sp. PRC9]
MNVSIATVDSVKAVIVRTLEISDRADALDADTALFGSMPELDSLALLELATSLEDEFGFVIDDEDFTEEVFATVGSLAEFVERKRS